MPHAIKSAHTSKFEVQLLKECASGKMNDVLAAHPVLWDVIKRCGIDLPSTMEMTTVCEVVKLMLVVLDP